MAATSVLLRTGFDSFLSGLLDDPTDAVVRSP